MASAYAILVGELRLFNDAKTGTQANQFAIDPKQVGAFYVKSKSGFRLCYKVSGFTLLKIPKWYQFEDKKQRNVF